MGKFSSNADPISVKENCNPPPPTRHITCDLGSAICAPIAEGGAYPKAPKPVAALNQVFGEGGSMKSFPA